MRVNAAAERSLRQGHPWLFENSIVQQSHVGKPGDLAVIFDQKRRFLAVGLYDPTAIIRVRVLQSHTPAEIDRDWFLAKIQLAVRLRNPLTQLPPQRETNGYRVVFGENDGLPGFVIDRYAHTVVIKLYTPAWLPHLQSIISALPGVLTYERLVLRLSRAMMKEPDHLYGLRDGEIVVGEVLDGPVFFLENGLTFEAEPALGQKTGFFLDQRENRARVEKLSAGKSVLNIFSYTGGFSVYAGRGGAREVVSVDLSQPAIAAAKRNWKHNLHFESIRNSQHTGIARDAFTVLSEMAARGQQFDMVILDPPMFAHKQEQIQNALKAYDRLTRAGVGVIKSGGILVQASCSSRVDAESFFSGIHQSAASVGRSLDEIERSGHALDHPVGFPEGGYLKCLFARVN
jgi:23S rRNA (cytosine1962-C5)-methyltransferase